MEHTPARSASFFGATVPALQSTPIVHLESAYYGTPHVNATNSSYNSSVSSALFSEDDGYCSASMSTDHAVHSVESLESMPRANSQLSMEGRSHVDFLAKLESCTPVLCKILGYLQPRDLAAVCRTSQAWRRVCQSVEAPRWEEYIRDRQEHWESSRENIYNGKPAKKPSLHVMPLTDNNSRAEMLRVPEPVVSRVETYAQEGKNLKDGEWHWPCPVCTYPSRVSNAGTVGKCKQSTCGYQFCPKCRRDYHSPKPCNIQCVLTNPRTKKNVIGSKHSKQQLRRL